MSKYNPSNMKQKPKSPTQLRKKAIVENAKRKAEQIHKATREAEATLKHEDQLTRKRDAAARRKREERSRYSEKGLIPLTVQIKPAHKEAILQYIEGLNRNDNC